MDNETPQTPNDGTPVVELRDVNKHFDDLHVLRDVNLSVHKGEVVVVLGPSGSGKSTLCRAINRLETIQSGSITIDGKELPEEGKTVSKDDEIVVIESVKAASDIVAPVAGVITAVNEALPDTPGAVNEDPMGAWFFRIKPADGVSLDGFMDEAAYNELIG